jgi:hypothetical protein
MIPTCSPKYAKIQELQAAADQLQVQLDALQAAIDDLQGEVHDHDADYSPLGHDHNSLYSVLAHNHNSLYSVLAHNHNSLYSVLAHNHNSLYSVLAHNHSGVYSPSAHNHSGVYSPSAHNHSGVYSPSAHNHSGVYSPSAHNHDLDYSEIDHIHNPDWASNHLFYVRLYGGGGTQAVAHATSTLLQLDSIYDGNSALYNGGNPYTITVDDDFLYLWLAQIRAAANDIDNLQLWIQGPGGTIYGQNAPLIVDRVNLTTLQAIGIGPGGASGGHGVGLYARHTSGANRNLNLDTNCWLACLPFSRVFGGIS